MYVTESVLRRVWWTPSNYVMILVGRYHGGIVRILPQASDFCLIWLVHARY